MYCKPVIFQRVYKRLQLSKSPRLKAHNQFGRHKQRDHTKD